MGFHIRIDVGRSGVHYRQCIDDRDQTASLESNHLETAPSLAKLSEGELVERINQRISRPNYPIAVGLMSAVVVAGAFLGTTHALTSLQVPESMGSLRPILPWLAGAATCALGIWVTWLTRQRDQRGRTTTLHFEMDDEPSATRYASLQDSISSLGRSGRLWRLVSRKLTSDWKHHAGASSLINRERATAGRVYPPYIQTNLEVNGIALGRLTLFFFPDQILLFRRRRYNAIGYGSVVARVSPVRFHESEPVPEDAKVVGETWQYVRTDGGPDTRVSSNRQIPIVRYGELELSLGTESAIQMHVSDIARAESFTQALTVYAQAAVGGLASPFESETQRAQALAAEKPDFWEYLLTAELLRSRMSVLRRDFTDLESAVTQGGGRRRRIVTGRNFLESAGGRCTQLSSLVAQLTTRFNEDLPASWGSAGEPGDVLEIKRVVDRIATICHDLLEWESELRSVEPPESMMSLKQMMQGWALHCFDIVDGFTDRLVALVASLVTSDPAERHIMELVLDPPPNFAEFEAELERLGGQPAGWESPD